MILSFRHLADPATFFRPAGADRKPNRFRSNYGTTLRALDDELRHLGATEATARVVLENGEADLRLDGALRTAACTTGAARPRHTHDHHRARPTGSPPRRRLVTSWE